MRYSVTGRSRELQPREVNLIKLVIASLTDVTELSTGAAAGVDTVAYYAGRESHEHAYHRLCVPYAKHDESVVSHNEDHGGITERCMMGLSVSDSYMNRNDRLVAHADILIAFPETDSEQIRSGTWSTIRRARRAGLDVQIYPLDGKGGHKATKRGRARGHRRRSPGR